MFRYSLDLGGIRRRCVARGRHDQSAVGDPVLQCLGEREIDQQPVDNAGRERIAPADSIEDSEPFVCATLDHTVDRCPRHATPIVDGGRSRPAALWPRATGLSVLSRSANDQ